MPISKFCTSIWNLQALGYVLDVKKAEQAPYPVGCGACFSLCYGFMRGY